MGDTVKISPVRGNKGRISGLVGADAEGTQHYINVLRITGVPKNPLRENTGVGDQGHATYAGTLKSFAVVVRGQVIHDFSPSFLLLGTPGAAEIELTTGMKMAGSLIAYEAPFYWRRPAEKALIDVVFKAVFTGIYTEVV